MSDSVGQLLKFHREARGLTLEEVSKLTKVQEKTLNLIESDQFQEMPSPTYTKGFIKLFAQAVGADVPTAIGLYLGIGQPTIKQELVIQNEALRTENPWGVIMKQFFRLGTFIKVHARKLNPRVWMIAGGIVILLISVSAMRSCRPTKDAKTIQSNVVLDEPKSTKLVETSSSLIEVKEPPAPIIVQTQSPTMVQNYSEDLLTLTAKVRATVWIRLYCDDSLVFEGTLKKGLQETWKAKKYFKLRLGNPEAVDFILNGKELGHIGPRGKICNIRLTQEGWYISD